MKAIRMGFVITVLFYLAAILVLCITGEVGGTGKEDETANKTRPYFASEVFKFHPRYYGVHHSTKALEDSE